MTDTVTPSGETETAPGAAPRARTHYWHGPPRGRTQSKHWPPGEDLAALRRGLGREPGSVPQMWPFYTTLSRDGRPTDPLRAEHAALTLFAVHQQAQTRLMHLAGVGLGDAVRALRRSDKFSDEAVDRRFAATATATSIGELTLHLRGLVTQLRDLSQPLDYDQLVSDLVAWQHPARLGRVRRRWGGQYFALRPDPDRPAEPDPPPAAEPSTDHEHRSVP